MAGNSKSRLKVGALRQRHFGWLLLILLTAASLRLHKLADIPPGLTHDEADHGLTAWSIVNGERGVYFTVGYGREPFYDYATAVIMSFLGPTYLAGRLVAVFFSLILLAGMVVWVRRAFDDQTALLTAAGLAVGFWPVMSARQALRSVTLPALFVLAIYFFWRGLQKEEIRDWRLEIGQRALISNLQAPSSFLVAGLFLGVTFYTYIPARILWVIFPALLVYLALFDRALLRRTWPGTVLMLLVAAVVALPLFHYLYTHPAAEVRVRELSAPLVAAMVGDWQPLLANVGASLRLFTVEGDHSWRYNIPGRPFLMPALGALFYGGIAVAAWRVVEVATDRSAQKQRLGMACLLALAWLAAGFSPALVTGPDLSTTQAIGMQPVLYLFPALALTAVGRSGIVRYSIGDWRLLRVGNNRRKSTVAGRRSPVAGRLLQFVWLAPLLIFGATAVATVHSYFVTWANHPEVRVQYETAMATAIDYLNENGSGAVAVSTTTPNRFHTPALAQMRLRNKAVILRYFDARSSLLIPQEPESLIIFSGFAPLNPALSPYFETAVQVDTLPLRDTDRDRPLTLYRVDNPALLAQLQTRFENDAPIASIHFGSVAEFLGYDLQTPAVIPREPIRLATLWRVKRPIENAVFFTHVPATAGAPLAQADQLDVPSDAWQPGDVFIQLHEFTLPADTAEDQYPLTIGLYICLDEPSVCHNRQRLPVMINGISTGDTLELGMPLIVTR